MKTVIKDKDKLLENLQMPKFDKNNGYCKGNNCFEVGNESN